MLISVVIPTYNRRALVLEAIDSAWHQAGVDFEIIVVDDGSTDGTYETLREIFGTRIIALRSDNHGVSAARNLGVRQARGEVIAFLDSDDLWLANKLAVQAEFFASHPQAEICQTDELWIRHGVRVNPCDHHRKPDGDIFVPSLQRCLVSPSAVMLRRSLYDKCGGFDESLPACEDYDLWLRIAATTPVHLIDTALVVKRGGHADQLSRRFWGMDRFRVASLLRLLGSTALSCEQRTAVVDTIVQKTALLAHGANKRCRDAEAKRYQTLAAWARQQAAARSSGSVAA